MTKKYLTWLLAASLCATSVAPVYGAEFTSIATDGTDVFTDSQTPETDFLVETIELEGHPGLFCSEVTWSSSVIKSLKFKDTSKKLTYWVGLDSDLNPDRIDFSGLELEINYGENDTETIVIDKNKQLNNCDGKYFFSDNRGNQFYLEWKKRPTDVPGFYPIQAKAEVLTEAENGDECATLVESAPIDLVEVAAPSPTLFPVLTPAETYGKKAVTTVAVQNKRAYGAFTPAKDGLYKFTRNDKIFNKYEVDTTRVYDKNTDLMPASCNITSLKAGETYYVLSDEKEKASAEISVEYMAPVVSMEWIKKPSHNYLFMRKNSLLDGPFFHNGEIKISYDDGSSEIIKTDREGWEISLFNKYGFSIYPSLSKGSCWKPKPGVCDYSLVMKEAGMKVTLSDIEIKPESEIPTIKEKGTIKATVNGSYGAWFRLKTGKNQFYKIECLENKQLFLEEENGQSYLGEPVGNVYKLKPNSFYYIRNSFHEKPSQTELTYRVTPTTNKPSIKDCKISFSSTCVYTGKVLKPSVKVTYKGKALKANKDYKLSYSHNQHVGIGKIKITGVGKYADTVTKSFKIIPAKTNISTAKRNYNGQITLKWKKAAGATDYAIVCTTDGKKWSKIGTTKSTSFTDKHAKKGTSYQYKIRPYKKVGKANIYGPYSAIKKIK